jgi:dTMP kinase
MNHAQQTDKGHFIVVEGLEGAGKTSALSTIKRFLTPMIGELIITREPGGTRVGEVARELIKETIATEPMDARTELLLLYAARVQLVERVIRPALARGVWVLGDRFELSTFAYQGGGRKISLEMIAQLSQFCLQGFKPDLMIFLDISPENGLERALKRSRADRIEQEALEFFKDVYDAYHQSIKKMDNVVTIDASKPFAMVQAAIRQALGEFFRTVHA